MHFIQRDHASGTGYEYALGRPEIRDGDITVPAGWGPMSALTFADALTAEEAATFARLLGCMSTRIAPPAEPARKPTQEERAAAKVAAEQAASEARKARVAAYLAEQVPDSDAKR